MTLQVDEVQEGDGRNLSSRTPLTIEDLKTKIGTLVDGVQIRGHKHVVTENACELKLGHCPKIFRCVAAVSKTADSS